MPQEKQLQVLIGESYSFLTAQVNILHKRHFVVGSDENLMTFTIGLKCAVELAELILAILDAGFTFLNQKKKQLGCHENKHDAIYFEYCNRSFIYKQVAENPGATEKNPYAADAGVESDNVKGRKAHVEFFHGIICR